MNIADDDPFGVSSRNDPQFLRAAPAVDRAQYELYGAVEEPAGGVLGEIVLQGLRRMRRYLADPAGLFVVVQPVEPPEAGLPSDKVICAHGPWPGRSSNHLTALSASV